MSNCLAQDLYPTDFSEAQRKVYLEITLHLCFIKLLCAHSAESHGSSGALLLLPSFSTRTRLSLYSLRYLTLEWDGSLHELKFPQKTALMAIEKILFTCQSVSGFLSLASEDFCLLSQGEQLSLLLPVCAYGHIKMSALERGLHGILVWEILL